MVALNFVSLSPRGRPLQFMAMLSMATVAQAFAVVCTGLLLAKPPTTAAGGRQCASRSYLIGKPDVGRALLSASRVLLSELVEKDQAIDGLAGPCQSEASPVLRWQLMERHSREIVERLCVKREHLLDLRVLDA